MENVFLIAVLMIPATLGLAATLYLSVKDNEVAIYMGLGTLVIGTYTATIIEQIVAKML